MEWKYKRGVNISGADNYSELMLIDVNGEGLPNMIMIVNKGQNQGIRVRLNNGAGFRNSYVIWATVTGNNNPWNESWSSSINLAATGEFTFGIFPLPIFFKLLLSGQATAERSFSREKFQLTDIDGDGVVDLLFSDKETDLKIQRSNISRSGLLKTIATPLGGTYTLAYHKMEPTPMHSRRWAMDTVVIYDNHPGDGADYIMTTYKYDTGYYDRKERFFYGFSKVTATQHDTENNNGNIV